MSVPIHSTKPYLLLTGATGMLGSQLLAKLLLRQLPVTVLVRPKTGRSAESAYQRIDQLLLRFEQAYGRNLKRPVVLTGDINQAGLGLCADSAAWCRQHVGRVLHSAASLSFLPASESPDNEPYRTNVDGGATLIRCATDWGIGEFHYVSTAYVCGLRTGEVREDDLNVGQSFSNDYERSKLLAETALHQAFSRDQLTIYRPSIVIDSSGLSPVSQDRTIYGAYSVFKTLVSRLGLPAQGEWFGLLGFDSQHRKNLVEAEWVAEQIVEILDNQPLHGRNYHLTSRGGTSVAELEAAFFEAVQSEQLVNAKPTHSKPRSLVSSTSPLASASLSEQSSAILGMLAAPFINIFQPYFRDDPSFKRHHLDEAMNQLDIAPEPSVGTAALFQMLRCEQEPQRWNPGIDASSSCPSFIESIGYASEAASQAIGIITSGPAGVDLAIDLDEFQPLSWGGEACTRRIYLSHSDWQKLLVGELSLLDGISLGRVLIESDHPTESDYAWLGDLIATLHSLRDRLGDDRTIVGVGPQDERLRSVR